MHDYMDQIFSMGVNKRNGYAGLNKAVMILAALDLIDAGDVNQ